MREKFLPLYISLFLLFFPLISCTKLALRLAPPLFSNFASSIFEECDVELARKAIPANLKLMEGLLKNDPNNKNILSALSLGYAGYSLLFVEAENPRRASDFYLRSINYGIKALGRSGAVLWNLATPAHTLKGVLSGLHAEDFQALMWTTLALNAWINVNLEKPEALARLGLSQACVSRVLEMNPSFLHGLPHILAGVNLAALPPMFGGNPEKAKAHFEEALKISHRKFFLAHYYYARYYAVRVQDKKLFLKLIRECAAGNSQQLKDVCLINSVCQARTKRLHNRIDELFF
ncbi:MAG: hypothetical protein JRF46_08650 [Deltaproteobacteria bacterium]|nr:hypothetical protein [Deltaproteobacteria bacterium]MBW2300342.1 hypothetical protein [Deltaproteobacteria bacterium]